MIDKMITTDQLCDLIKELPDKLPKEYCKGIIEGCKTAKVFFLRDLVELRVKRAEKKGWKFYWTQDPDDAYWSVYDSGGEIVRFESTDRNTGFNACVPWLAFTDEDFDKMGLPK